MPGWSGWTSRELHHGAVRFAGLEERFLPARVAQVHADRLVARGAHALERGREVGDLERDVVLARTVLREEAREEVVLLGLPLDQQLDGHRVDASADAHLHPAKAVAVATREDGAAELDRRAVSSAAPMSSVAIAT